MIKLKADGTYIIEPERQIGGEYIKFEAPERPPGSIERRTDFNYMFGHGTFYKFVEEYFPDNLLTSKKGEHLSLVLYNLNTDQLDEVVFEKTSQHEVGPKSIWIHGYIDDIEDCFEIKIEYYLNRPLESYILVFASGRPYFGVTL
ncbi:MAG: hypothetical protein IJH43_00515 [Mogibacterium sp.]|nr:hypothetical protein [Mogibacterium sp.]